MFPLLSLSLLSSSRLPPLPPDMPLRSPHSLLRRYLNPDPDLDPDLNLVVDAHEAAVPLDLFLLLPQGDLGLDPDLVLDLDILYPPPLPPLFLCLLGDNNRQWGECNPLF